jgi:outer membrane lipoprotein-sorting protein
MLRTLCLALGLALSAGLASPLVAPADAQTPPTAEQLLAAIDKNLVTEARRNKVVMTVNKGGRPTKTYTMISMSRGKDEAAVEYLEPLRDKGQKMLRRADELWIYMPSTERVQKISGHMLRQGLSGSDVSYEDMMANSKLQEAYEAKVVGAEDLNGRPCWKMELTAKDASITYPKRISWIDQALNIPLKQELYAVSGMLLKTWEMTDIQSFGDRQYPTRMVISDKVQQDTSTEMVLSELEFAVALEDEIFSQRWLERK